MKCVPALFITVFLGFGFIFVSGEEFVCQPGISYIENDCNDCYCPTEGKLGCTLKACYDVTKRETDLKNCKVGTAYEKGCNKCWCVKGMGTICTNNEC